MQWAAPISSKTVFFSVAHRLATELSHCRPRIFGSIVAKIPGIHIEHVIQTNVIFTACVHMTSSSKHIHTNVISPPNLHPFNGTYQTSTHTHTCMLMSSKPERKNSNFLEGRTSSWRLVNAVLFHCLGSLAGSFLDSPFLSFSLCTENLTMFFFQKSAD